MNRPVILIFLRYYLPGYKAGGPVRTIANMVEALGDDFDFRIVTSDRDLLDSKPYPGVIINSWMRVSKAMVYYVSSERFRPTTWATIIQQTPHHAIYFNSLFDVAYSFLPLLATRQGRPQSKPALLAPRGELSPGALALKRWKKAPFLAVAKRLGLYRTVRWHASTAEEAALIRGHFGMGARVAIAEDLSPMPRQSPASSLVKAIPETLKVVFLSRISRIKNLDYALSVFAESEARIQFDIWGALEDPTYWNECQQLIRTLPKNVVSVQYRGVASHAEVRGILSGYDLLFLPTRGENFGHVIAEALSVGTPVLISDQTPWRDLQLEGVGWDLPLENGRAAFLASLREAVLKSRTEGVAWRQRVREFANRRLNDPSLIEANRKLFLNLIAETSR